MVRRIKRKKSASSRVKRQALSREQVNIAGEAKYVVTLSPLVLFSTEIGDAWMLDPQDGLALCLALEGEEQPFTIVETPANFSIEWSASYRIDGDKFVVTSQPDRVQTFFGYPTAEILRAIRRAR
jgi:hypothetical protein